MFNILLSSLIIRYVNGFLSKIYNPVSNFLNLNSQNNPDMDNYISEIHEPFNKTKLDIETHIPFHTLINVPIEETNYTKFLEGFSNW
jgi:hypothetical protein